MSIKRQNTSLQNYNLDTVESVYKLPTTENTITNFFWHKNHFITNQLCLNLDRLGIDTNIIDVGCGTDHFPKATHLLDISTRPNEDKVIFSIDLDFDKIPYTDSFFNFAHCRHTLEDIQNPSNAFNEIVRVASQGYIETPSPLVEIMKGVDGKMYNFDYSGYCHHRYIVWSDLKTNTLYFLPKYPLVEYIHVGDDLFKKFVYMLNHYSVYWNNYYVWNPDIPPKIFIYRNGVNMDIIDDYHRIISNAIEKSIEYTNNFIQTLSKD